MAQEVWTKEMLNKLLFQILIKKQKLEQYDEAN